MNKVILIGRLTADPEVRQTAGENAMTIARYNLAVDRRGHQGETDFISCVAFGRNGEFAEKYLHKGTKVALEGHIQTGSYTNKEGKKVYTTDVIVDSQEFCEKKADAAPAQAKSEPEWMNIPEDAMDDLPFGTLSR